MDLLGGAQKCSFSPLPSSVVKHGSFVWLTTNSALHLYLCKYVDSHVFSRILNDIPTYFVVKPEVSAAHCVYSRVFLTILIVFCSISP